MSAQTRTLFVAALLAGSLAACGVKAPPATGTAMKLTSTAFADGRPIPQKHAFGDQNLSPALQWSGMPPATKSLALICDDPDAPTGTWVHWVIYNLPPTTTGLAEDVPKSPELADGAMQGVNDFKQTGYGGPAPPSGKPHRYYFKIYALDAKPELKSGLTKNDLLKTMDGHVIAEGQLMGTYQSK